MRRVCFHPRSRNRAFTLVELLVVIGVLVAQLLPAVQAAREEARRAMCLNNIKQFVLAFHNYHDTFMVFPLQGYPAWNAHAGRPWGWGAMILPYIEQKNLFDALNPNGGLLLPPPTTLFGGAVLLQQEVPGFRCPSDCGPPTHQFYPFTSGSNLENLRYSTSNYAPNQNVVYHNNNNTGHRGMQIITDGTSNTFLMAEHRLRVDPRANRFTRAIVFGRSPASDGASTFHAHWRINSPNPSNDFNAGAGAPAPSNCKAHIAASAHPGGALFGMCDAAYAGALTSAQTINNPGSSRS